MDTLQEKLQEKLKVGIDHPLIKEIGPTASLVAVVLTAALAAGVAFAIYRRRRRRSLVKRLQDALPEIDEIRATLKRPLERAVKFL